MRFIIRTGYCGKSAVRHHPAPAKNDPTRRLRRLLQPLCCSEDSSYVLMSHRAADRLLQLVLVLIGVIRHLLSHLLSHLAGHRPLRQTDPHQRLRD